MGLTLEQKGLLLALSESAIWLERNENNEQLEEGYLADKLEQYKAQFKKLFDKTDDIVAKADNMSKTFSREEATAYRNAKFDYLETKKAIEKNDIDKDIIVSFIKSVLVIFAIAFPVSVGAITVIISGIMGLSSGIAIAAAVLALIVVLWRSFVMITKLGTITADFRASGLYADQMNDLKESADKILLIARRADSSLMSKETSSTY